MCQSSLILFAHRQMVSYCRPSGIKKAVPKLKKPQKQLLCRVQAKFTGVRSEQPTLAVPPPPVMVPDADRMRAPYQTVGFLLFTMRKVDNYGTMLAVEVENASNTTAFTAAHNLTESDANAKNTVFIQVRKSHGNASFGSCQRIDGRYQFVLYHTNGLLSTVLC